MGKKKKKKKKRGKSNTLQSPSGHIIICCAKLKADCRVTTVSVEISASFKIAWFFTLTKKGFATEYTRLNIMRFLNSLRTQPTEFGFCLVMLLIPLLGKWTRASYIDLTLEQIEIQRTGNTLTLTHGKYLYLKQLLQI